MAHRDLPPILRLAALWLVFATWSSLAGWGLSAMGALHGPGYGLAAVLLVLAAFTVWRATAPRARPWVRRPFRLRWRRPGFAAWLAITALALLGGLLHPPSNYDALTYRLPRLYFWLQEQGWFWIDHANFRLNIAGTGLEWMSAPLILGSGGERWLFLLNFVPYLLLPGLFFLGARGLGLRGRTARWWMWVLPMAYGIVLQAASIGNDMICAVWFLSSLAFAVEARKGRPVFCLGLSALAAALMTGVKVTMLPLGLPLAVVWIWVGWGALPIRRLTGLAVSIAPVAAVVSFLPMAFLCWKHTGDWTGNPDNVHRIALESPRVGLVGNGLDLGKSWLAPPLLPGASKWDAALEARLAGTEWYPWLLENYARYRFTLGPELPSEEGAGAGLGLALVLAAWLTRSRIPGAKRPTLAAAFAAAVLISALVFLMKAGGAAAARLMLPWVPGLLLAGLWLRSPVHRPLPGWVASLPALMVLPGLVLNPNRPLVPGAVLAALPGLPQGLEQRIHAVYSTYASRHNLLEPLASRIPDGEVTGFAGGRDHPSAALFRPLDRLQVVSLGPDSLSRVTWIVGTPEGIRERLQRDPEALLAEGFILRHEESITSKVQQGPENWLLLEKVRHASPGSN